MTALLSNRFVLGGLGLLIGLILAGVFYVRAERAEARLSDEIAQHTATKSELSAAVTRENLLQASAKADKAAIGALQKQLARSHKQIADCASREAEVSDLMSAARTQPVNGVIDNETSRRVLQFLNDRVFGGVHDGAAAGG